MAEAWFAASLRCEKVGECLATMVHHFGRRPRSTAYLTGWIKIKRVDGRLFDPGGLIGCIVFALSNGEKVSGFSKGIGTVVTNLFR